MYHIHFTSGVLAIFGWIRIGCHGIPVPPEDPPLGTLHRMQTYPLVLVKHLKLRRCTFVYAGLEQPTFVPQAVAVQQ